MVSPVPGTRDTTGSAGCDHSPVTTQKPWHSQGGGRQSQNSAAKSQSAQPWGLARRELAATLQIPVPCKLLFPVNSCPCKPLSPANPCPQTTHVLQRSVPSKSLHSVSPCSLQTSAGVCDLVLVSSPKKGSPAPQRELRTTAGCSLLSQELLQTRAAHREQAARRARS